MEFGVIDGAFVRDAVAARDAEKLHAACKWAVTSAWNSGTLEVVTVLLEAIHAAQHAVFYGATRQFTMADMVILTSITPFRLHQKFWLKKGIPSIYTVRTMLTVLDVGIETDSDRDVLVAVARWCFRHDADFAGFVDRVVHAILHKSLAPVSVDFQTHCDAERGADGAVRSIHLPSRVPLILGRLILKKVVFLLEEGYISHADCQPLCRKFELWRTAAQACHVNALQVFRVCSLLQRGMLAASCNWSPMRVAWVQAVVIAARSL